MRKSPMKRSWMGCCALLLTGGKCTLFISPLQRETKQTIAVCVSPESTKKLRTWKKIYFSSPRWNDIYKNFFCMCWMSLARVPFKADIYRCDIRECNLSQLCQELCKIMQFNGRRGGGTAAFVSRQAALELFRIHPHRNTPQKVYLFFLDRQYLNSNSLLLGLT